MIYQTKSQALTVRSSRHNHNFFSSLEHRWIYVFLGLLTIGYGLLTLNGYGNHDDIYRMISTWQTLLTEHRYEPSRFQGYLVPEIVIGLSSQIGDFYLSNLVSVILAIASLFIFYRLLTNFTSPLLAALAVLAVGTNPYWAITATTSTDYIYPAFFYFLGVFLLVKQQFRIAGIIFALSVSSRLTYAPMVVIALGFYCLYLRNKLNLGKRFFQGILIFLVGTVILYLPVFFASGMTFSFLNFADDASGGTAGTIARYIYKNVYLWGLPAFTILAIFFIKEYRFYWSRFCKIPFRNQNIDRLVFHAILWLFIYNQILFARLPHQYQYLIPVLFCVIFFVTQFPDFRVQLLCLNLVVVSHLIYSVVNFDVLQTYQNPGNNNTIHSDGAVFKPGIREGILLRDYHWRSIYQRRMTNDFNQRWQNVGRSLSNPR